ncbi:MAG: TetR/AcrR family transcriptional regulator [Bacteroidales bacterium]|nr:TetR/AcrR family transcriptional regulator [Bacteroidales bacterium]
MKSIDDQKLKEILIVAKKLFWKHGFKRITIEEICKEAKVSKMTFYKHFKNKKELVEFIINNITDKAMQKYRKIMDSDIPFPEKIKKTIDLKMEATKDISNEFINDYIRYADPETLALYEKAKHEAMCSILSDYVEAQKRGDIRKNINPKFILYFLNNLQEIVKDEQLGKLYDAPQDMIMELTNFFFYGILPR